MSNINEVFDIEPVQTVLEGNQVVIDGSKESEDADFDYARGNYYEIIEQGKEAIKTSMLIATETQNPRAVEVLSGLLKNMADINRQLIQVSKDKQDVKLAKAQAAGKPGSAQAAIGTQQNITFVGTSASLNKMIADKLAELEKGV